MKSYFVGDCRRFLTSVLSILLIAVGLVAQDDFIRVETNLISVPTQVMDKDGRYVSNLAVENFSIFEDGVLQKIEYFGPVDSPFTVLVLLDCSGSMTLHLETMAKAAESLIGQLRPEDQLMVYAFADDTEEILSRTRVGALRNIQRSKIEIRIKQSSATWVYDAVEVAQKKLESIRGRKAIVLFSDAISLDRAATAKKNL
jgi:VWFA-related protein